MENPFSPDAGSDITLKRNLFDLSKSVLFTTEIGKLVPLLSTEVIPGDTIKIKDSMINIQGMPTLYPLQTRLRGSVSLFYARNRNVHEHFEDFIFNTKDVEAPWLKLDNTRAKKMISTGSLGDMLGVPSTIGTDSSVSDVLLFSEAFFNGTASLFGYNNESIIDFYSSRFTPFYPNSTPSASAFSYLLSPELKGVPDSFEFTGSCYESFETSSFLPAGVYYKGLVSVVRADGVRVFILVPITLSIDGILHTFSLKYSISDDLLKTIKNSVSYGALQLGLALIYFTGSPLEQTEGSVLKWNLRSPQYLANFTYSVSNVVDATDDSMISNNPFVGDSPDLKLSAFKFRHYEQICNYYFRNDKNNPYVLNGEVQYNEFIPTHADGADTNEYDFHYRNWELDMFTSCTQSPQFGEAPLVGLTYNPFKDSATLTFSATDDDGVTSDYKVKCGVDRDGNLVDIADFSKDIPSANLRKLIEAINYGISINDLRVTNSFQRFLENTLRRGLRYRNQLKSHFGTSVDYPDIDIPQYIGGFSGELVVGRNESTADTEGASLGDFTGKLFGQLKQTNTISKFIPEHGFIFAIFSLSPIPQYPQSIDPSLLKTSYLDYFVPEFGKSLGHVPVPYSLVCPLQNYGVGQSVHDIFGYQKAYFEYMQSFDEVHCDFRTNLKDFAMLRTFKERPVLCEDFTTIHPDQVNDVFVTRNVASEYGSSEHFLCNAYFNVTAARPIPKVGTPSLE